MFKMSRVENASRMETIDHLRVSYIAVLWCGMRSNTRKIPDNWKQILSPSNWGEIVFRTFLANKAVSAKTIICLFYSLQYMDKMQVR